MTRETIVEFEKIGMLDRGGGVRTWPLIIRQAVPDARFTTGISSYPPGTGAPLHYHNCDEQVTLLEGSGEVEIDGRTTPLRPYDSTYIRAGRPHCFRNTGNAPMKILWIYGAANVTRTFVGSDETVEHLSDADMMSPPGP